MDEFSLHPPAEVSIPDTEPVPDRERLREELVGRFDTWLEGVLSGLEEPPQGLAAEFLAELDGDPESLAPPADGADRYAVWSALTALTQEIKLQGRAFKDLGDTLKPVAETGETLRDTLEAYGEMAAEAHRIADEAVSARGERDTEIRQEAERRARGELLGTLMDVHERLRRGLESARPHLVDPGPPSRLGALFGAGRGASGLRSAVEALEKGYRLGLENLEDRLRAYGVSEVPCLGRPFDPARMSVADIEETDTVPEGTVLEVYRPGYEWTGNIFRPAQVKVARALRTSAKAGEKESDANGE